MPGDAIRTSIAMALKNVVFADPKNKGAKELLAGRCHVKQFYCRNAVTRLCSTFVFSMP